MRRFIVLALSLGLLGGCKLEDLFKHTDTLDQDEDDLRRFPWGPDFDDDDDGALQFVAGGTDYDDTDAGVQANAGDGTFDAPVFYATGLGPSGLYLADFDTDDNLDLVTSNENDFSATFWFGAGDGDGILDIVTIDISGNQAAVQLGG